MSYGLFNYSRVAAGFGPSDRQILPQFMPSIATDMCDEDIHITEVVLTNNTSGVVTVRLRDKQATPMPLIPDDVQIAASTVISFEFPRGALMVGGVSWSCNTASAVVARVRAY